MRTHKTLPLLAASALLLAGCTSGTNQATQDATPSESPTYYTSTPEPTTPAPEVPKEVTYRATSNVPGQVYWGGNGESHEQTFTDSFEVTLPVKNEYDASYMQVSIQYSSEGDDQAVLDTAQLSCQLLVNGEVVQEKNGSGSTAGAYCSFPLED